MKKRDVHQEVFLMGLSPRHKGFHYLCTRILYMAAGHGRPVGFTKVPGENVPVQRVERCMRYAIQYAWDMNEGMIREVFPYSKYPPAPIEFAHAMLWRLCEEENESVK